MSSPNGSTPPLTTARQLSSPRTPGTSTSPHLFQSSTLQLHRARRGSCLHKAALGAAVSLVMGRIPKAAACRPRPSSLTQASVGFRDKQVGQSEALPGTAVFVQGKMAAHGRTLGLDLDMCEGVLAHAVDAEYGPDLRL